MVIVYHKLIIFILIIATAIDLVLVKPIFKRKDYYSVQEYPAATRFSRQVVQPKWLNFGPEPVVDPTVHVNKKNLLETAQIREAIRKAKEEDANVVYNKQKILNQKMKESTKVASYNQKISNKKKESSPILFQHGVTNLFNPLYVLSNWIHQMQKLAQTTLKFFTITK